jgi:DNA polymerase III sliding clamp (beta) subunit (PCNA family)
VDFITQRAEVLAAIDKCSVAAPGGHTNSAFDMMRVETKGKKKVGFVTVGERAAVDTVGEATVKDPGSFNVRPKHLRDIASAMPDGPVQFSLKGTRVTVKSTVSKRKASFESSVTDVFHIDDPGKEAAWVEINARELTRALRIVHAASQTSDSNPVASLLIMTERGVNVFGCNMHLLALVETSIRVEGLTHVVLPDQACAVLTQMSEVDDKVRLFTACTSRTATRWSQRRCRQRTASRRRTRT